MSVQECAERFAEIKAWSVRYKYSHRFSMNEVETHRAQLGREFVESMSRFSIRKQHMMEVAINITKSILNKIERVVLQWANEREAGN